MCRHNAASRPALCYDQARDHACRLEPSDLMGDLFSEAHLDVQTAKQFLHVAKACLSLDDQERSGAGVKGDRVTATAIAIPVEAHLHLRRPIRGTKALNDHLLESCVPAVHEPIELLAVPTKLDEQRRSQRGRQALEEPDSDAVDLPSLEAGDRLARDTAALCQIPLAPSSATTEEAGPPAQVLTEHRSRFSMRGLTAQVSLGYRRATRTFIDGSLLSSARLSA
jgi:hypothetical protein